MNFESIRNSSKWKRVHLKLAIETTFYVQVALGKFCPKMVLVSRRGKSLYANENKVVISGIIIVTWKMCGKLKVFDRVRF